MLVEAERDAQFFPVHIAEHAAAEALLDRAQQDTLRGDAVVPEGIFADAVIEKHDDVRTRSLPFRRTAPLLQVPCPSQGGEDPGVAGRLRGQKIFQGLEVGAAR